MNSFQIKIEKKKDSEPESDIEIDVDSDNESSSIKTTPKKEDPFKAASQEAPIAVPLSKFEPMPKRHKKIHLVSKFNCFNNGYIKKTCIFGGVINFHKLLLDSKLMKIKFES